MTATKTSVVATLAEQTVYDLATISSGGTLKATVSGAVTNTGVFNAYNLSINAGSIYNGFVNQPNVVAPGRLANPGIPLAPALVRQGALGGGSAGSVGSGSAGTPATPAKTPAVPKAPTTASATPIVATTAPVVADAGVSSLGTAATVTATAAPTIAQTPGTVQANASTPTLRAGVVSAPNGTAATATPGGVTGTTVPTQTVTAVGTGATSGVLNAVPNLPTSTVPRTTGTAGTTGVVNTATPQSTVAASNLLSPNTILAGVGDTRGNLKFLTDPVREQAAIQDALLTHTGQEYLDPTHKTAQQQQAALYQGTVDFLNANPTVKLGDELTGAQRLALTKPLLWYETQIIDGQPVLVPQILLPEADRLALAANTAPGTLAAVNNLALVSTGDVTNTGTITAGGVIAIEAATFENERRTTLVMDRGIATRKLLDVPVVAAREIDITTQGNLLNYGGKITANEAVRLQSLAGNVTNDAAEWDFTTVFTKTGFWGNSKSYVSKGTAYEAGQILSGGTVEVYAGNGKVINRGSDIAAAAGITIVADTLVSVDVKANTFTNNGSKSCGLMGCSGSQTQSTITQRSTIVSDSGDININVKHGDFVNRGSTLMALDGTLSIRAQNVVFETAAFEEINKSWTSSYGLTGFSSSKTTSNSWTVEVPKAFANAIDIRASGNVTGVGAQIKALDSLTISAGGDIDFKALQLSYFTETKGFSVGFQFPGSAFVQAAEKGSIDPIVNSLPLLASVKGLTQGANPLGIAASGLKLANILAGGADGIAGALNPMSAMTFGVTFTSFKSRSDWTSQVTSSLEAGGNLTLAAGHDLNLIDGTKVAAGGDIALSAVNDILIAAAKNTASSSSSSTSVGVSFTMGAGFGGSYSQ